MPDSTLSRRSVALHARLAKYPSGNHKIIPRIFNRRLRARVRGLPFRCKIWEPTRRTKMLVHIPQVVQIRPAQLGP